MLISKGQDDRCLCSGAAVIPNSRAVHLTSSPSQSRQLVRGCRSPATLSAGEAVEHEWWEMIHGPSVSDSSSCWQSKIHIWNFFAMHLWNSVFSFSPERFILRGLHHEFAVPSEDAANRLVSWCLQAETTQESEHISVCMCWMSKGACRNVKKMQNNSKSTITICNEHVDNVEYK